MEHESTVTAAPAALGSRPPTMPQLITESDGYTRTVAGVTVNAVRIGKSVEPHVVLGVPGEQLTMTESRIGFPIATYAHVPEDRVVVAVIKKASADSRWSGIPLRTGSVMVYAPGAEHAAVNRPGLHFSFALLDADRLRELADRVQVPLRLPPHGGLMELDRSPCTSAYEARLAEYGSCAQVGRPLDRSADDVHQAIVTILESEIGRRMPHAKGIDSRAIVRSCIDFAEYIERIPSIGELCLAAHVSERRLRAAFTEEFDQPPSRWFRAWALDLVHRRLRRSAPDELTVTQIATGLGFVHLGRFAGHYRQIYGERPSATLESPAI